MSCAIELSETVTTTTTTITTTATSKRENGGGKFSGSDRDLLHYLTTSATPPIDVASALCFENNKPE